MSTTYGVLLCLGAFLLGGVPFGYIAGKLRGVDLRTVGSGNIGATNVARALGKPVAALVLALDVMKGLGPVLTGHGLVSDPSTGPWWIVGAGLAAILGHTFSPFLGFRGGKGVATSLGVLLGLSWQVGVGALAAFLLVFAFTQLVSLGSLLAAAAQAGLFFALPNPLPYRLFGLLIGALVLVKHRENIKRLLAGTEPRFGEKKPPETGGQV